MSECFINIKKVMSDKLASLGQLVKTTNLERAIS